jgi:hypothetical protein
MADIHDLSISDIREFLSINGIYNYSGFLSSSTNNDIYDVALNLMKKRDTIYDDVPISIIEWMLAHNTLQKKINIPSYTKSQIEKLNSNDLNNLSKSLGLTKNNIDNVINILHYMHKLNESELDFERNTDLYINLLINSNFNTIIKLLKAKPLLRYQIPELFYDILITNKNLLKNRDKSLYYKETSDFTRALIDLKYFDLIEKILPIISEDDKINYFNLIELFAEKRFLDKYFKYFPNEYRPIFRIIVANALNNKKVSPYYLIRKVLEFAINNNNLDMIKSILDKLQINHIKIESEYDKYNDKYNIRYGAKFYGIYIIFTEKEKDNLDILIKEARKLMLNK